MVRMAAENNEVPVLMAVSQVKYGVAHRDIDEMRGVVGAGGLIIVECRFGKRRGVSRDYKSRGSLDCLGGDI